MDTLYPAGTAGYARAGAWEADGAVTILVAAAGPRGGAAYLLSYDPRLAEPWLHGSALLGREDILHGERAIAASIPTRPARARHLSAFGLLGPSDDLPSELRAILCAPGEGEPPARRGDWGSLLGVAGKGAILRDVRLRLLPEFSPVGTPSVAPPATDREAARLGYPAPMPRGMPLDPPRADLPAHDPAAPVPPGIARFDGGPSTERVQGFLEERLGGDLGGLRLPRLREAAEILGERNRTPSILSFYGADGTEGERRRQAGRLYPALSPVIANPRFPEIGALVGAGRPFEEALAARLRDALPADVGNRLKASGLRRMRAFPARAASYQRAMDALTVAASVPVDWLPRDAAGWDALLGRQTSTLFEARRLGLDVPALLRQSRDLFAAPREPDGLDAEGIPRDPLHDAADMAVRFDDTVIRPLRASMGAEPDGPGSLMAAGRALFGGMTLKALDSAQRRWHAGQQALEAALPAGAGANSWPAAFEAFRCPDGIEVACLTNELALKAEGTKGPDANGMEGLSHCVGGYWRDCLAGEKHVLSIRVPLGGGRHRRLSTVELILEPGDGAPPKAEVAQHRGLGNGAPPAEAEAALAALLAAIRDGTVGIAPEALQRRPVAATCEEYDWREPGAIEQAFEAWAPHLPAAIVEAGLDGLRLGIDPGWAGAPSAPRA